MIKCKCSISLRVRWVRKGKVGQVTSNYFSFGCRKCLVLSSAFVITPGNLRNVDMTPHPLPTWRDFFWETSNLKTWRSSEHMMKSQMNVFDDFCKFGGLACKLSPCCYSVPPLRQVPAMQKWRPKIAPNRLRHCIKQSHGIATGHENLIPPYPTSQMQSCCANNLYSYPPSVGKTWSLVWYGFKTCQFSEGQVT